MSATTGPNVPSGDKVLPKTSSFSISAESFFPPPLPAKSMYDRLRRSLHVWSHIKAPPRVLSWIREGVRLPLLAQPSPFFHWSRPVVDQSHRAFLATEIPRLIALGAIRKVPESSLTMCCSAHVVDRPGSSKKRLVIDHRPVNSYVDTPHVRFAGLKEAAQLLYPSAWTVTLDMKDGYLSIPIHPDFHNMLAFNIDGSCYQVLALPFGSSISPFVYHTVMDSVVSFLRETHGLRMTFLLDDILLVSPSRLQAELDRDIVCYWLDNLGILRNREKGQFTPSQETRFLGMTLETSSTPQFSAQQEAVADTMAFAKKLLDLSACNNGRVPLRLLMSFAGKAVSLTLAVPEARLRTRSLYSCFPGGPLSRRWTRWVKLSDMAVEDLNWWLSLSLHATRTPARPPSMLRALRLYTDASSGGFGACLDRSLTSRWDTISAPFLPPQRELFHITEKELAAALIAISHWSGSLAGQRCLLLCDNQACVRIINNGCSRSHSLFLLVRKLWEVTVEHNITLIARWIPSQLNMADRPSRSYERQAWRLTPEAWQLVCSRFGLPSVDLFACRHSALLPDYCSFHLDDNALAQDAFSVDWSQFDLPYANPPFALVPRVLAHATETHTRRWLLVIPDWPSQWWYSAVRSQCVESMVLPEHSVLPLAVPNRRLLPEPWCNWSLRLRVCLMHTQ